MKPTRILLMLIVLVGAGGCAHSGPDLLGDFFGSARFVDDGARDESWDDEQESWDDRKQAGGLDRMPYDASDPRTPWS